MQIYHYTLYDVDGSYREDTGRMALRDDNAARAFGKAIIRDVMSGDDADGHPTGTRPSGSEKE